MAGAAWILFGALAARLVLLGRRIAAAAEQVGSGAWDHHGHDRRLGNGDKDDEGRDFTTHNSRTV